MDIQKNTHNQEKTNENKKLSLLKQYILENTPKRTIEAYASLSEYAQTHDFGILDEDVVVLDTETTGFSFNHDQLIQIAAARLNKGEITDWYVTFVNPGKPIPDEIVHLTHITEEHVKDAPGTEEAVQGLVDFVGSSLVVAHNVGFDYTFCTKYESGKPLKENIWIDSLDLARIVLPRFNSHRLLDLVRAFGGPESTHRADDDVAATCLVYRILLAGAQTMPEEVLRYIASLAPVSEWNTGYVFKVFAQQYENELDKACEGEIREGELCKGELFINEPYKFNLRDRRKRRVATLLDSYRRDAFEPLYILEENTKNPGQTQEMETGEEVSGKFESGNFESGKLDSDKLESLFTLQYPTDEEIIQAFSTDGLVGSLYEEYEPREEQKEMSLAINRTLRSGSNLAIEAGTGVGKSMAYLVPLALLAKKNSITVGVATKTNALLDQLLNKELPLLESALGVSYASLKGFTHYICNRKVEQLISEGAKHLVLKSREVHQAPAIAALISFIEQTDYDDIDGLKIDYGAVPRWQITSKSTECLRRKCPYFGRTCFVHGAREQAQRSDVVVTNHSLLFWDVRLEGGILPPIRYWVVDEAHGAEQEARQAFSLELASGALEGLIKRVASDSARQNVLLRAERCGDVTDEGQALFSVLVAKAHSAAGAFAIAAKEYTLRVKDLLYFAPQQKSKGYEYFDLWLNDDIRHSEHFNGVAQCARSMQQTLEKLIACMRDIVVFYESAEISSAAQREIALVTLELRELYEAIEQIFLIQSENNVYSVRMNKAKDKHNEVFTVQPLNVGSSLNETLYQETNSVIYTSATLAVDSRFDSFERGIGLNQSESSQGSVMQVESSYDFDNHMRVFVPSDIPEPNSPDFLPVLQQFLIDLHKAQNGSLLTLFTNRKEMENSFEVVNEALKPEDLRLVCQKWGVSVKGLRDDFLKDEKLSLFALKSFWEGFDAPGATLRGVVVTKLPFGLPTDPLSCERAKRDDRAWANYSLPSAVIEVKQAVGRLIRTSTDEGIVVLTDHRLISKYYGKKFLNSLPSKNIAIMPMADIIAQVEELYRERLR
ncbi:MAG: helicase C-terminal domain-containing protein [Anaerotardibacter sp.]